MTNPWFEPLKHSTLLAPTLHVTPSRLHIRPRPSRAVRPRMKDCWLIGTMVGFPPPLIWANGSPTGPKFLGRRIPGPSHSTLVWGIPGALISTPQVIVFEVLVKRAVLEMG